MHAINAYLQNLHYTLSTTQMLSLTSNQDFKLECITSSKVGCVALINACVRLVERGKLKTCIFMNQAIVLVPADNRLRVAARRTMKSERITLENNWRAGTVYYRWWFWVNKVKMRYENNSMQLTNKRAIIWLHALIAALSWLWLESPHTSSCHIRHTFNTSYVTNHTRGIFFNRSLKK